MITITGLDWQAFDPEPTPEYIDVEVALDPESGWYHARARAPFSEACCASAEEAAEEVRLIYEREFGRPFKIRRPKKKK